MPVFVPFFLRLNESFFQSYSPFDLNILKVTFDYKHYIEK